jgi:phosphatidate cytidylyltransferase
LDFSALLILPLPINTQYAMLAVIGLLLLGSFGSAVAGRRMIPKDAEELRLRLTSWWIMIGLIFIALVAGRTASLVFFALLSFFALREFLSILPIRQLDRRVILALYLMIPVHYYWIAIEWYGVFIIFIPVYLFLFIPFALILLGETKGFIRSATSYHWAVMTTVFALSHIAYLLILPADVNPAGGPVGLVLYLLFLTQFNDVMQYVWGKALGRRKIVPNVSPNKTWAGFVGGLLTTMVLAAVLSPWLTPLSMAEGLIAGVLIGGAGFVGDLMVSAIKRDLGIKDTGTMIPGHGGILDRVDSLIYTAPLFFHFIYYLKY